jgi:hypothetical protein
MSLAVTGARLLQALAVRREGVMTPSRTIYHCKTCGNAYYYADYTHRHVPEKNEERLVAAALRGEVFQVDSCYRCSDAGLYARLKDARS